MFSKKPWRELQKAAVLWYRQSRRELPWRVQPVDPYKIWISEAMSQQSVMTAVVPYFERWMEKFPNVHVLARASESQVLKAWEGLGYYSRARNVHASAKLLQQFLELYERWPNSYEQWLAFPGVGNYTAKAIAAMAFGQKVIPLDGNLIRVFSRLWMVADPLNNRADLKTIQSSLENLEESVHPAYARELPQALMDLGSQICRPKAQALCALCPIKKHCQFTKHGKAIVIPKVKMKKTTQQLISLSLSYRNHNNDILLRKIPKGRRLEGFWELPTLECRTLGKKQDENFIKNLAISFEIVGPTQHAITNHRYWCFRVEAGAWRGRVPEQHRFFSLETLQKASIPISTISSKLLKLNN